MATTNIIELARELKEMGLTPDQIANVLIANGQTANASAKGKKSTKKSAPKPELVEFRKADGTTKLVTPAQAAAWEKYRSRELTEGQKNTITLIRESKVAEIDRTRALEKALGIKANSLKNTACTCEEVRALGWKGTKAELKAIKAQIRAK